jgi:HD-GYP domain-containing protein (c-di-GMP phosphodiesterase class II)
MSNAEQDVQNLRRLVLNRVAVALKLTTIYHLANAALARPLSEMLSAVNAELELGELRLQLVGDNVFLNRELVKLDFSSFESAQMLRAVFKRLSIAEIAFHSRLDDSDLKSFLRLFQQHYQSKTPQKIAEEKHPKISVRAIKKGAHGELESQIDERQNVVRTYAVLQVATREMLAEVSRGRGVRVAKARRAIHQLFDAARDHESLLLGLTRFPNLSEDLASHLVAVCAVVMLMTRRVSLPRAVMTELCIAALLHDVGRASLSNDSSLNESDLDAVQLATVLDICSRDPTPENLTYAAAAGEIAWPVKPEPGIGSPGPWARLIAVPCAFDRLSSPAPSRKGLPPDHALRLILDRSGDRFDPTAVRLFSSVVGLYPVGTTVRLTSGETAIVMEMPHDAADFARPIVKVIRDESGPTDRIVDLAHVGGLEITGCVDAVEEGINPAHFLLA